MEVAPASVAAELNEDSPVDGLSTNAIMESNETSSDTESSTLSRSEMSDLDHSFWRRIDDISLLLRGNNPSSPIVISAIEELRKISSWPIEILHIESENKYLLTV